MCRTVAVVIVRQVYGPSVGFGRAVYFYGRPFCAGMGRMYGQYDGDCARHSFLAAVGGDAFQFDAARQCRQVPAVVMRLPFGSTMMYGHCQRPDVGHSKRTACKRHEQAYVAECRGRFSEFERKHVVYSSQTQYCRHPGVG